YEAGEHAGQHYFAMKLIDGEPLSARVDSFRAAPRDAARLLALLARAVQHAHERGILHRDLKPANVLLAADGTPFVTDFRLARREGGAGGGTEPNAILGTRAYAPPEQAAGRVRPLTTASDVYSLGAILYELLTGRPPFTGPTAFDVLLRVVRDDPVPPRQSNG